MNFITFTRKAIHKVYQVGQNAAFRIRDGLCPSYGRSARQTGPLQAFPIAIPKAEFSTRQREALKRLLSHEFNFLGSGWFTPTADKAHRIRLNRTNRRDADRIASLLPPDYHQIDWHSDPKSGYRWRPDAWHSTIPYGIAGEDILLPWTLSRMQQLPFLARCAAQSLDKTPKDSCRIEFQNQILDFIAANPPRWGVHWASPMDVSIRAINWLAAYDLFMADGAEFPEPFLANFRSSLLDHGRFIFRFREWHPVLRNNHYLSDLVGLIVIAAHLPKSRLTGPCLSFGAKAFIQELFTQFNPDGSNFEASTCYHMLSTELALLGLTTLFSLTLVERQTLQKALNPGQTSALFPPKLFELLKNIQGFMNDTLSPEGEVLQIGDNDSSRILKLQTAFWIDGDTPPRSQNFQALRRQMDTLIMDYERWNQLEDRAPQDLPFAALIRSGTDGNRQPSPQEPATPGWKSYPDMGLFLYRDRQYRLSIRCGPVGQNGIGGHAHNDQLSITLHIHKQPVIVDPGSYCYTPDPQTRMTYRSTAFHNTLTIAGREQNTISPPEKMVFRMIDRAQASGQVTDQQTFTGRHRGYGPAHTRTVKAHPDRIEIEDTLALSGKKELHFHLSPSAEDVSSPAENQWVISGPGFTLTLQMGGTGRSELRSYAYSPEYGCLQEAKELVFIVEGETAVCTLSIK